MPLLPASFRGVPFGVFSDEVRGGRAIAMHRYPGREKPWAEDLGKAPDGSRFRGYIADGSIQFAGGPIELQRAALRVALAAKGSGLLIHPSHGPMQVVVLNWVMGQDLGAGTMSTVDIEFAEAGDKSILSVLSSASGLLTAANVLKAALVADGIRLIAVAAANGGQRSDMQVTAALWTTQTIALGTDATALSRVASLLPGQLGRFSAGANAGAYGVSASPFAPTTTIDDLIARASAIRLSISSAAKAVGSAVDNADLTYATDVGTTAVALVESLAAACADPADGVRLLSQLIQWQPPRGEALTAVGVAFTGMMQRAAAAELVLAAGQYQPSSADDAADLIRKVGDLIDNQATASADANDNDTFNALRSARAAVTRDIRSRAATLAELRTFTLPLSLPSAAAAQRLYGDLSRADQLVAETNCIHPMFLPIQFEALAA